MRKVFIIVLTMILVFGITSSAFALTYSGSCTNNFFTDSAISDGSATYGEDDNYTSSVWKMSGSTKIYYSSTKYSSRVYNLYNHDQPAQTEIMQCTNGGYDSAPLTSSYSAYVLKVSNLPSGYTTTVTGNWNVD